MALDSHGRASFGNGAGPPPSTLAAQLVKNISTPAKSSRPDETQELKRLFSLIEKIKNDAETLKSPEQRVEDNHMLIYVYARVVLDSLKWDDPFADRARLRSEALKAINFLKVTITETPNVVKYTTDGQTYLFRGQEPLWLWILPKILKMLGHQAFLGLTSAIEGFCRLVLLSMGRSGLLLTEVVPIICYIQGSVDAVLDRLQRTAASDRDASLDLEIPPQQTVESIFSPTSTALFRSCSYQIEDVSHGLRHVFALLSLLAGLLSNTSSLFVVPSARDCVPWLVDSLLCLQGMRARWSSLDVPSNASIMQCFLDLCSTYNDCSAVDIVIRNKIANLLVFVCARSLDPPSDLLSLDERSVSFRRTFCLSLVQLARCVPKNKAVARLIQSQLLNHLTRIVAENAVVAAGTDFSRCVDLLAHAVANSSLASFDAAVDLSAFTDAALRPSVEMLRRSLATEEPSAYPTAKRRKLSPESPSLPMLLNGFSDLFGVSPLESLAVLEQSFIGGFEKLNDQDRCVAINFLAHIPCAADNTLQSISRRPGGEPAMFCSFCHNTSEAVHSRPACVDVAAKSRATTIFTKLIDLPCFTESRRPRVIAMMALRRLILHSMDPTLLDVESSGLGGWCLRSLSSSIRELRIAAGKTMSIFLRDGLGSSSDDDLVNRNRGYTLSFLKSLSDTNTSHLNETCIMAWRQAGSVVPDEQLSLVLVKLLEFLGHRNQVVSGSALNEIINLASARRRTPRALFEPFWRDLAYFAIKDMVSKPQITRMIAELLGTSVSELVLQLQQHALPWLILTKRKEVVQKIAEFRGEKEIWRPCVDNANLGSILALLMTQDVNDSEIEQYVLSLFRQISPHFDRSRLVELVGSEPVLTVLELLKAAGEADEARKPRIRAALSAMASVLLDSREGGSKKNTVGRFLQQHALGITTRLSEVINDDTARDSPVQEKIRCIRAMEEMIKFCKAYIRIARPQISAFLLTALAYDKLRAASMSCWAVMLTNLEDEDVEALIETTFFVIGYYWESIDVATRGTCRNLLLSLLRRHHTLLKDKVNELPSFARVPDLADIEGKLAALRRPLDSREAFRLFSKRLRHENSGVILQALTELASYLKQKQGYLQASAVSEQPDSVVTDLMRALLDCSAKYNGVHPDVSRLCVECIGLVGCMDSNRLETVREQRQFVVVHNFESSEETADFVLFILEEVLVKAFLSVTDTNFQGFLSYAMQELLDKCEFKAAVALQTPEAEDIYRKWLKLPDNVREVLTPFLTSRYRIQPIPPSTIAYPIFRPGRSYAAWLRSFVLDLLHKPQNEFARSVFEPLSRTIKVKDLVVAEFLLPYLIVHLMAGEEDSYRADREQAQKELLEVLQYKLADNAPYIERENKKLYCEAVFRVLDYCLRWIQSKKSQRGGLNKKEEAQVKRVQKVIDAIPPAVITTQAMDCRQYSRALFFLEPYIERKRRENSYEREESKKLFSDLQYIYAQIDEPDGLEGISAQLPVLDLQQQMLSHRKAGRWAAAQTWYEIRSAENPEDMHARLELLSCLKESGQHDVLLNHVEGMNTRPDTINKVIPFAVEASWATGRWETLEKYLHLYNAGDATEVFDLGVASALLHLKKGQVDRFTESVQLLREKIAASMSYSATSSLQASHDAMFKSHVLTELEMIAARQEGEAGGDQQDLMTALSRRLEVIGAFVNDKQYLLSVRRAAMELMRPKFADGDISSLWLSSAQLARKAGSMQQSFNAVLHAYELKDGAATIDNARLLWKEGHHRKAIQVLRSAITNSSFIGPSVGSEAPTSSRNPDAARNLVTARAHLLLAKWLDSAGQTHATALRLQYQQAAKTHPQWEKGHYYLGRHYKKVLESESALKPDDQSDEYLSGETAKLVIENYLRSLNYGTKYLYQTLPRILTLWLELGAQVDKAPEGKVSLSRELHQRRKLQLQELHKTLGKALQRLPAYIFYTALPQIVARIAHPNPDVYKILQQIIIKVVESHPRQALWGLFGIITSSKQPSERKSRGMQLLTALQAQGRKSDSSSYDVRLLIKMGEKLANQLLIACNNGEFQSNRTTVASITRDLNFNHKCTPCPLVVPIEACLTATLPTLTESVKKHKAFSRDVITIDSFLDEVLVLGSLAKPRKLTARGSDGKLYGLLIKPKDDLRTDQRLMEFNSMINRSLKRDAECSRRQLYIRTNAVTPLNEECGVIEWVDGLKTLRDILLELYKARGISPNYGQIAGLMKEAASSEENVGIFTDKVLGMFPAVLPLWFTARFPNPSAWFAARLRYARSCAVMSMVGTILGLGDRHGENVLLEEGNGGVFHVDFNCLFDKGLTFAQPERVPFRLTHNMTAAMGVCRVEGPFRRCCELTLSILRQQEETLMTILEAFVYDPTLDLQREKQQARRRQHDAGAGGGVRLNPQSVVDSIRRKVRGLLPDESIPLGVEGQVEELIKQAVDPRNLAAMYIGWCPFL